MVDVTNDSMKIDELLASLGAAPTAETFKTVEQRVPGLTVARAGSGQTFTAEGILHSLPFFLQVSQDQAWLRLGPEPTEDPLYASSITLAPDSQREFSPLMVDLVQQLRRAPFTYAFRGKGVNVTRERGEIKLSQGEDEIFIVVAQDEEEALALIAAPDPQLYPIGLTDQLQEEIFALQAVTTTPVRPDTREFPVPEPVFTVSS